METFSSVFSSQVIPVTNECTDLVLYSLYRISPGEIKGEDGIANHSKTYLPIGWVKFR
jgi:hypothetical protein